MIRVNIIAYGRTIEEITSKATEHFSNLFEHERWTITEIDAHALQTQAGAPVLWEAKVAAVLK